MAKAKKWIQNAIKKPGALHRELGVAKGKPTAKAKRSNPRLKRVKGK